MTWLYMPSTALPSAQALGDSNSVCGAQLAAIIEQSVTWRGKHMSPQRWSLVCKTGPYATRLSGVTLKPSTLRRGLALWTSSLRVTRASRLAKPVSARAQTTSATYGLISQGISESSGQLTFFAKTSSAISPWDSTKCATTFRQWTIELKRESLAREKLALCMLGSASFSLPTPMAQSYGTQKALAGQQGYRPSLETMARKNSWPTPRAQDAKHGAATPYELSRPRKNDLLHARIARMWPTPTASTGGPAKLDKVTWSATGAAYRADGSNHTLSLQSSVRLWPTPTVCGNYNRKGASPTSADGLCTAVAQAPETQPGQLNPQWVELLMGFPAGWTVL